MHEPSGSALRILPYLVRAEGTMESRRGCKARRGWFMVDSRVWRLEEDLRSRCVRFSALDGNGQSRTARTRSRHHRSTHVDAEGEARQSSIRVRWGAGGSVL